MQRALSGTGRWSANDGRTRCSGKREWWRSGRLQDRTRKLFRNLVTTILSGLLSFLFFPPSSRWTRDAIPVIYSGNLVWRIAHPTPSSFSLLSLRGWSIRIYLEGWFSRRQSFPFLTDRSFVRTLSHPGDTGGHRLRLVACTPCCTRFQAAVLPKDGIKGERSMTRILSRVWRIVKLRNFFSLCLCQLFCIEDKRYKDPFLFFPFL